MVYATGSHVAAAKGSLKSERVYSTHITREKKTVIKWFSTLPVNIFLDKYAPKQYKTDARIRAYVIEARVSTGKNVVDREAVTEISQDVALQEEFIGKNQ